jgi:hypothetical protein
MVVILICFFPLLWSCFFLWDQDYVKLPFRVQTIIWPSGCLEMLLRKKKIIDKDKDITYVLHLGAKKVLDWLCPLFYGNYRELISVKHIENCKQWKIVNLHTFKNHANFYNDIRAYIFFIIYVTTHVNILFS